MCKHVLDRQDTSKLIYTEVFLCELQLTGQIYTTQSILFGSDPQTLEVSLCAFSNIWLSSVLG